MTGTARAYYRSPIGAIEIVAAEEGITALNFISNEPAGAVPEHPILRAAISEIDEYFRVKRRQFSVPVFLKGTDFQMDIWRRLVRIPYGQTVTYSGLAEAVGRPRAVRAVGQANHRNPVSIIIPCHRVIGSDGRLTGYGGGLWRKEWLLAHEKKNAARLLGL